MNRLPLIIAFVAKTSESASEVHDLRRKGRFIRMRSQIYVEDKFVLTTKHAAPALDCSRLQQKGIISGCLKPLTRISSLRL